jgi:hypothetical protein
MKFRGKPLVHLMRGGAPDKIMFKLVPEYDLMKHDNCNLVSISKDKITSILSRYGNEYIMPADEGDIRYANQLNLPTELSSRIILPQDKDGRIIEYDKYVPKDSMIYTELGKNTDVKYPDFCSLTFDEFKSKYENNLGALDGKAIKTATGSGSRGVFLICKERIGLGGKYVEELTPAQFKSFMDFAEHEGKCNILVQDISPALLKCNTDFIIRDGKLITYKWDIVNQSQQFTNWDNFHVYRNKYTDTIMSQITKFLCSKGIYNAFMNFESFTDFENETYMVEFNWRYSNTTFEYQAFNKDLIELYLDKKEWFSPLDKKIRCSRYWRCIQYEQIPNYIDSSCL